MNWLKRLCWKPSYTNSRCNTFGALFCFTIRSEHAGKVHHLEIFRRMTLFLDPKAVFPALPVSTDHSQINVDDHASRGNTMWAKRIDRELGALQLPALHSYVGCSDAERVRVSCITATSFGRSRLYHSGSTTESKQPRSLYKYCAFFLLTLKI